MKTLKELNDKINELQKVIDSNIDAANEGSLSARITILTAEEMKEEVCDAIDQMAIANCLVI